MSVGNLEERSGNGHSYALANPTLQDQVPMIKVAVFLAAIAISALALFVVRRRGSGDAKITDKRARAEAFKQLLALSDEGAQAGAQKITEKNTVKVPRAQPAPVAPMTRQQRRAEQRKAKKLAFAKSQHA